MTGRPLCCVLQRHPSRSWGWGTSAPESGTSFGGLPCRARASFAAQKACSCVSAAAAVTRPEDARAGRPSVTLRR
jgi:hypothetical protein